MTDVIATRSMGRGRLAAASLLCTLLSIAIVMAVSPGSGSAVQHSCDPGESCLWLGANQAGGLCEFAGSDHNLQNDHFENANTATIVSNNTGAYWNRRVSDPPTASSTSSSRPC